MSINGFGPAQGVVRPGLKHLSAGWVDQELLTVRKMAAAGATAEEIGAAIGKSTAVARNFIRRNKLVWNRKSVDRHVLASAGAIGGHVKMGHGAWVEEGLRLRALGYPVREISRLVGASQQAVAAYFERHKVPLATAPIRRKRRPSETKMLALILQLHIEGTLSEGQVCKATGLDRIDVRERVDVLSIQARAA